MANVQIAIIDQQETQIALSVPGIQGPVGTSFPSTGGTIHQLLVKNSNVDFDASWTSSLDISSLTFNDGTY
jgi:nicotinamide mononucleotide (NMN) deamidase PncC